MPGGELTITWDGDTLGMSGPATTVFTGQIDINTLIKSPNFKDASQP